MLLETMQLEIDNATGNDLGREGRRELMCSPQRRIRGPEFNGVHDAERMPDKIGEYDFGVESFHRQELIYRYYATGCTYLMRRS